MLHQILNSFNPESIEDPFFGTVELHFNEAEKTYYLMKDAALNNFPEKLSLTIESKQKSSSQQQSNLFQLIDQNFSEIMKTAEHYISSNSDTSKDSRYEAEAIFIGELKKGDQSWELSLINAETGSSYCIIEWQGTKPISLSVEE